MELCQKDQYQLHKPCDNICKEAQANHSIDFTLTLFYPNDKYCSNVRLRKRQKEVFKMLLAGELTNGCKPLALQVHVLSSYSIKYIFLSFSIS